MQKLGLFGGTFDPVHNGHLAMARAAREALGLSKILWIPTGKPRYRDGALASGADRVAMLRAAIAGEPGHEVDERELEPDATGYTVDTLRALRAEYPQAELVLLMGADQYSKLGTWHRPDEVARLAKLAVFARPGWDLAQDSNPPWGATVVPMTPIDISASAIRARAARGEDISGLVPPAVANHIARHRLYR